MYCMMARNQMKPGKVDAVAKALEKDLGPIMKKTKGFRNAYMVAGPNGEYMGFLLFDSRASADSYVNNPSRKKVLETWGDMFEGPMKLEFGEVRIAIKA